jgi:sugar lactone lactonase YvrE
MQKDGKLAQFAGYTGYEFKLRWWFPEDGYRAWETTGLGGFLGQAVQPATWAHLWRWWATRTPFDQAAFQSWSNVYPFYVYVRNDLVKKYVPASWASARQRAAATSTYTPPALPSDVPAALTRPVVARLTVDGATLPRPMAVVRAVAVDAAGNIYLTDSAAQRVVKLDRAGHYLTSWGSSGAGPGQFGNQSQGPMGIAVGPNGDVYVADTWNHRVEEFSATGAFMRAFGHPNPASGATGDSFYGPRQLAVAPNGDIYVADTGNERIQVYSPRGVHLFNIGSGSHGLETALGRFDEPSGVAIDRHGVVYVADYWDKRIQRFTLDGKPLGPAFPVAGWATGDYGEPYLAVDNRGHLFATDAPAANTHAAHVLEMDAATGRVIRAFGAAGPSASTLVQPSGIAVSRGGALYIADAGAAKLLTVQP